MSDEIWVNDERTILVTQWWHNDGGRDLDVAVRKEPSDIWSPPIRLHLEASVHDDQD